MSRCVILSAGPIRDPATLAGMLTAEDTVYAADGGWQLAQLLSRTPTVLVADFDSLPVPTIPDGVKLIHLPVEKDETDTAAAVKYAYDAGFREFLLLGCTGGRLDHQQAVFALAADYAQRGCQMVLADEQNEIHFLTPGSYVFPACEDEKISLFAFCGPVTGLFTNGLMYDVTDLTLAPTDPLCVSNECMMEDFCLSFRDGLLLLYFSKDH